MQLPATGQNKHKASAKAEWQSKWGVVRCTASGSCPHSCSMQRTIIPHWTVQKRTSRHLAEWAAELSSSHSCRQQGQGSASLTIYKLQLCFESALPASAATLQNQRGNLGLEHMQRSQLGLTHVT